MWKDEYRKGVVEESEFKRGEFRIAVHPHRDWPGTWFYSVYSPFVLERQRLDSKTLEEAKEYSLIRFYNQLKGWASELDEVMAE